MNPIWFVAPVVLVLGAVPAIVWATRAAAELRALRGDLANWSAVRPALVEVRTEADALRERFGGLRRR